MESGTAVAAKSSDMSSPLMDHVKHHRAAAIVAIILTVLGCAAVIWFETHEHSRRLQYPSAPPAGNTYAEESHPDHRGYQGSFMVDEDKPIQPQIDAHPGKRPRFHFTLELFALDREQLRSEVARLREENERLRGQTAGK